MSSADFTRARQARRPIVIPAKAGIPLGIIMALSVICAVIGLARGANAHEVRPAYLEMRETSPGEYAVLWKVPMRGDLRLSLEPEFSGPVETSVQSARIAAAAALQSWTLKSQTLRGQTLRIRGLEYTLTDVLARIAFADGSQWTARLTARAPSAMIPVQQSAAAVSQVYFLLGVEHILFGFDHLLFVLLLIMVARAPWPLIKTITAFTAAHSITLTLAALGFVRVPQAPVEAVIALSIVFVAAEVVRGAQSRSGLAARAPWLIAFAFGLLHGLGFAGALSEIGLPDGQIPVALLFFNLGVEAGQLLFVTAVLSAVWALKSLQFRWTQWRPVVPAYGIGAVAAFWLFERVASF